MQAADEERPAHYYWKTTSAGDSAEFVSLFCRSCKNYTGSEVDVPLLTVMRDTLGDRDSRNDRITDLWLLTYSRPGLGRQLLSAVPFFYWRLTDSTPKPHEPNLHPFLNVSEPQHSVVAQAARNILQLTVFDPLSTSVRASTRAYQNNRADHERLHIEEAESYLMAAPADDDGYGLSKTELHTVIARLELRKRMLGGLVNERRAAELGEQANFEQERIRARNWELLRQCADKTGLVFEPVDLAGANNQYAVLWFPVESTAPPEGTSLGSIWKLLNVSDPYLERAKIVKRERYRREIGGKVRELVPLGVYSLTYPRMPLLLVDFRDGQHLRFRELTQRAINEITSGVIGVSRITNWYYFVAADVYDFWVGRHGSATNQMERLACYSKFRVALALDHALDANLRAAMQLRVNSLATNPLDDSPPNEMRAALERYDWLQTAAANGGIDRRLAKQRREELARFEAGTAARIRDHVFHYATLGFYTHESKPAADLLARLERARRAQYDLAFLDQLANSGTVPEVAYDSERIKAAVNELAALTPEIGRRKLRQHAAQTIERLSALSNDTTLKAEYGTALDSMRTSPADEATPSESAEFEPETHR